MPSQLYSFSFAPNPDWSRSFSPQPEIQAYIRRVAEESGTLDRFRFHTSLESAAWDDDAGRWRVELSGPSGPTSLTSTTLVLGAGGLSEPRLPDIDGIDGFQGELFHSARWDHDVDLAGKRVAVIGTGASAIQIVPEIPKVAGHLDVYQRTAPWVLPRNDRTYARLERLAFRHVPGLQKLYRTAIYWGRETYVPGFTLQPKLALPAKKMALANLAKGVSDPELRERLTPTFEIGCKRVLISNDYYPALDSDNVEVVTDGIAKVTGNAIVTADGVERPIDVLIVATGFFTTELPITEHITGRDGRTLAAQWRESGMAAYKGTTVPGFPNLFLLVGPNTGLGHSTMVFMIESQVAYLREAVRTMGQHRSPPSSPPGPPRGSGTPTCSAGWSAPCGARVDARAGTSTPTAATPRCGRARRSRSAACSRSSTWRRTTCGHPGRPAGPRSRPHRRRPDSPRPHRQQGSDRMKTLDDKVVVITGAGSGIGRALAVQPRPPRGAARALRRGRGRARRDRRAGRTAGAREVRQDRLDVSDRAAVAAYADAVAEQFGRVNVVVNNAGVAFTGDLEEMTYEDMDWIVGINFWGVVNGTKEFLPHLIASGDGHVVNISSLFGLISMPGQSAYNATKYAVRGFTEALRQEMLIAGHPVGVTACTPAASRPRSPATPGSRRRRTRTRPRGSSTRSSRR